MKRRTFVRRIGGGAVVAGLVPVAFLEGCSGRTTGPAPENRFTAWTWVHGGVDRTPEEWSRHFHRLSENGFHAVLVSGGETSTLADAAHEAGLQFHRWLWILNRSGDSWAQENHPEWFTVSRNGDSSLDVPPYVGYYRWVCPTRPAVREYLRARIDEVAADPRVDGVHLDYIRHCDVILPVGLWEKYGLVQNVELPEFDYCYCDVCRKTFEAQEGIDPLILDDPPSNEAWVRFRQETVTGVVTDLADTVHARNKPISAAVFPGPGLARKLVRQAWDDWPIDMFFPMLYHSFYEADLPWIGDRVEEGVAALEGTGAELRAGLYLPDLDPNQLAESVRRSRAGGAAGVALFEMDNLTDAHLSALREELR